MSSLVTRPGRNAAREAKRIKAVRKVQNAIQWHETQRKKRQTLGSERWNAKQAVIQRLKWEKTHIHDHRKTALANIRDDWRLGPLRPNRAPTADPEKYGAMAGERMQKPEVPIRSTKNRNAFRERKGLAPEYPLIVDDKRYFPLVKGDRVAILSGIDKGKIGVVEDVIARTHELTIKGLNMQYIDSALFTRENVADAPSRHASEVPIPMTQVRLVVPYETIQNGVRKYQDVIVEDIYMERHTTGIDPFTGVDYGDAAIPENHQYHPSTGLPIFHRYIAGTRNRIEWPWESKPAPEQDDVLAFKPDSKKSVIQKALGTIRHPITSLKSWTSKPASKTAPEGNDEASKPRETKWVRKLASIERAEAKKTKARLRTPRPGGRSKYGRQGTRNRVVKGAPSMSYSLVDPPFPHTLGTELRPNIQRHNADARSDPDAPRRIVKFKRASEAAEAARETARARQRAADRMKTPMQLRWEMAQASKAAQTKAKPLVQTDALLQALGQHMRKGGVRLPKRAKKAADVDEVD